MAKLSDTSTSDDAWLASAMRSAGIVDQRTGKPSKVELAKRAGVSRTTVYNVLDGKTGHMLDPSIVLRIAVALKKPLGELLAYITSRQAEPLSMNTGVNMEELALLALFRSLRSPEGRDEVINELFEAYKAAQV
ncbi:hypothetical protein ACFRAQ_34485 [Nocardia sp. NPDC056611]|uniref:hypothetical protein n=1 Tax=Nocardia sp. NPDC056611 TaxID=3345877 RepID=UPI0036728102